MGEKNMREEDIRGCLVNNVLIAVHVLVFAAGVFLERTSLAGSLYMRGALYAPLLLKGQGFHRLVTSIFLHADAVHLFNNMVVQFAGGSLLEKRIGHMRYALIYFVSGVAGNVVSAAADFIAGSFGFSVGASGAIFGVMGALIFLILRMVLSSGRQEGGRLPDGRYRSLLIRTGIMTVYLLCSGWRNPSINQAAHVGGLVCGFLLCALLTRSQKDAVLEELIR